VLESVLNWVSGMSPATLYALIGLVAFIEALFPPAPADVVIALCAFLAARQDANLSITITVIVLGMTAGMAVVYLVARRLGADWMHARLKRFGVDMAEQRMEVMYGRYGMGALFLGRFVPGLRMIVPAAAGMLRLPFGRSMLLMGLASLIWYGTISILAYQVGSDWEAFRASIERLLGRFGLTAAAFLALAVLVGWATWRQRKARRAELRNRP